MKKNIIKVLAVMLVCALVCGIFPQTGVFAADLKLSAKKKTITVGESFTLTLKNATGKITWKSSDKKVATVKKGVVTGVSEGKVKIVAKNDGKKYTCKVTVKQAAANDRIDVKKTGIKADAVYLAGENVSVQINPDNWEECEVYLVNADGKVLIHNVYTEEIEGGLYTNMDPEQYGYIAMDNGLILCNGNGYYLANGEKAFELKGNENVNFVLDTSEFSDGIAVVCLGETAKAGIYNYLINEKGKVLVEIREDQDMEKAINEWLCNPSEGMSAYLRYVDGVYELLGYYNKKGKLVEAKDENGNNYMYGNAFMNGLAAVVDGTTQLRGFINKKGKLVIPCEYTTTWGGFYNGYALCAKMVDGEQKSGVIDKEGNVVIPFEYDMNGYAVTYVDGLFKMKKDGKAGALNSKGEVVIPFEYAGISVLKQNLIIVVNDEGKYGVVDNNNNIVIPFEYSNEGFWIYSDKYDMIAIAKDGKFGYISGTGEVIVPFEYDDITEISENGLIYAVKDGELYVINLK